MKLYLLGHADRDITSKCINCYIPQDKSKDYRLVGWNLGRKISKSFPIPIEYEVDKDIPLTDYLYTSMFQFLVSKRFAELIKESGAKITLYDSKISYEDKLITDDYVTINFDDSCACLDWDNSEYDPDDFSDIEVTRVSKLVIDETKVPQGLGIFRLFEHPRRILVTEEFKLKAEKLGITGIEFIDFKDLYLP